MKPSRTLAEEGRLYLKEQHKAKREAERAKSKEGRKMARAVIKKLSPARLVDLENFRNRLIKEGHFSVGVGQFYIRDDEYRGELIKCASTNFVYLEDFIRGKLDFIKITEDIEDTHIQATVDYVIGEVIPYLGENEIGVIDTKYQDNTRFKLYIKEEK